MGAQELFFVALGFICTIISWIKLRPVYAMWMTGSWILSASVNFFRSMPRYTLTMFPMFILFALAWQKPLLGWRPHGLVIIAFRVVCRAICPW